MNFKEYLQLQEQNTVGVHNDGPGGGFSLKQLGGGYLSSSWTGSEANPTHALSGHPLHLASTDLQLPQELTEKKTATIRWIDRTQSNIPIMLSDGTMIRMTYDEFRRIPGCKGEIQAGDQITYLIDKHGNSLTKNADKWGIKAATCQR